LNTPTGFASGAGASAGNQDAFVVALNPANGAAVWAVRAGSGNSDFGQVLATDGSRLSVGGYYSGTPTGFLSGLEASTSGSFDGYVAALNLSNGSTSWKVRGGGSGNEQVWGLSVDASRLYVSGQYTGLPTGFLASAGESAG